MAIQWAVVNEKGDLWYRGFEGETCAKDLESIDIPIGRRVYSRVMQQAAVFATEEQAKEWAECSPGKQPGQTYVVVKVEIKAI